VREIFGIILLLVQCAINLPLIVRIVRTKATGGISLTGETIWIAGGVGWLIYGIVTNSVTLMISGSLAALGCLIVASLFIKYGSKPRIGRALFWSLITFSSILVSWHFFDVAGLSVALSVFGVIQFLPQFTLSIRGIATKIDADGVSPVSSFLRSLYTLGWAVYAGLWFIWGITIDEIDWPLFVWGIAGFVTFGLQWFHGIITQKRKSLEPVPTA